MAGNPTIILPALGYRCEVDMIIYMTLNGVIVLIVTFVETT